MGRGQRSHRDRRNQVVRIAVALALLAAIAGRPEGGTDRPAKRYVLHGPVGTLELELCAPKELGWCLRQVGGPAPEFPTIYKLHYLGSDRRLLRLEPPAPLEHRAKDGHLSHVYLRPGGKAFFFVDWDRQWQTKDEVLAVMAPLQPLEKLLLPVDSLVFRRVSQFPWDKPAMAQPFEVLFTDDAFHFQNRDGRRESRVGYLETVRNGDQTVQVPAIPRLVLHEIGHHVHFVQEGFYRLAFGGVDMKPLGWEGEQCSRRPSPGTRPSSDYGAANPVEDFAESFALYRLSPETLREWAPRRYSYMREAVFKEGPADAASPKPQAQENRR